MIGVSKLLCGTVRAGDALRYGRDTKSLPSHLLQFAEDKRPIVVWNSTLRCNLRCVHCYADAGSRPHPEELSTQEARTFIDALAEFGAPVLLFSGGEPLMRPDLFELGAYARQHGLRTVISTNGTLIDEQAAQRIRAADFGYVGISLDGVGVVNDEFRGSEGAYERALTGIRNCVAVGQKVGLRFTIIRHNADQVPAMFELIEREGIDRLCFYHLVYTGRGSAMTQDDLAPPETRALVADIFARTRDLHARGLDKDILTVDNHCDGVFLYLTLRDTDPERAEEVMQLLRWNGGNSSGIGIANVDWRGDVHADQFWQDHSFGNIRERPFGEIWMDTSDPVMAGLKNRRPLLEGRCGRCQWQEVCNGNFRARPKVVYDDIWAEDPACYLTDEEIGLTGPRPAPTEAAPAASKGVPASGG
jgi:radical SAM protein with 4Fe4S-binding SPASM domain